MNCLTRVPLTLEQGTIWVFPTFARRESGLQVQYEWSAEEAQRDWRDGAVRLARVDAGASSRGIWPRSIGEILSAAAPRQPLPEQRCAHRRAAAARVSQAPVSRRPRRRARAPEFEAAVEQGRERLYPCVEQR